MIRILGTVFAALLGLAFGSFLNVCLSRWPEGESVVMPRSHCRQCGRMLAWWENVPLVSWIALRGRCRGCGSWIGWRYVAVEAAVGGLWAMVAWRALDPGLYQSVLVLEAIVFVVGNWVFYWLLVGLAALDAENLWLPNSLTLPGLVLGFIYVLLRETLSASTSIIDKSKSMEVAARHAASISILGIAAAAGLILLIRWIYWFARRREGIGLGDARLMALLAAWLGLPGALLAFGVAVVLGATLALIGLALPKWDPEESWEWRVLPLGTFLCVGGMVSGLWGQKIIAAYLKWAGL
ncbi:MAG TPA: prepilin peptidase [Terracidiphilus sp.]